jgi:hypothetical protein
MQCGAFRIDFGGLNRINLVFHDLEEKRGRATVLPKIEHQCSLLIQTALNPSFIHVVDNQVDWIYSLQSQISLSPMVILSNS